MENKMRNRAAAFSESTPMSPLRLIFRLGLLLVVLVGALGAQTTLYVTVSPYFHAYNATTGAAIAAPLGNTTSFNWESALDGNGRFFVALYGQNNVGVYDAKTGATLSSAFLPAGVSSPTALGVWGNNLYVASENLQKVSLFDATSGTLLSSNFITGFAGPRYLAIDPAGRLFVSDYGRTVGLFDAATGAVINRNFLSGLSSVPSALALNAAANRLYVSFPQTNSVSVFDATSGALLTANLITGVSGFSSPLALAVDPTGTLYASFYNSNAGYYQVGSFNGTTGAAINSSLLINGGVITSLSIQAVPEPATWVSVTLGLAVLGLRFGRRRSQSPARFP